MYGMNVCVYECKPKLLILNENKENENRENIYDCKVISIIVREIKFG